MRRTYLVCYDISDQKVYRKIFKWVRAFAVGGQKSCFECWMTEKEKDRLVTQIENEFAGSYDRADLFELTPHAQKLYFGIAESRSFNPFFIL